MFIVRPIQEEDFPTFQECALNAHGIITSLPNKEEDLKRVLENSLASFQKNVEKPLDEFYLFVLEDQAEKKIHGISAIRATSHYQLFYQVKGGYLHLIASYDAPSELCSLYILPSFRKGGQGKLLSRARLHFIVSFPERFKEKIRAEMRGFINEAKNSPFWDSTGRTRVDIRYEEAEALLARHDPSVYKFLFHEPVSVASLPPSTQEIIGKTHPQTVPALEMLKREGFSWSGVIDVVDGGPRLDTYVSNLQMVRQTHLYTLKELKPLESSETHLLSNHRLNFRALFAPAQVNPQQTITLSPETAEMLQVKPGDLVRL